MFDLTVFKALLNDIMLLLALCLCYRVVFKLFKDKNKLFAQIVSGFLFGLAAVIAIASGFDLQPGIVFDGRTIVIAVCGLFCGPIAVTVACAVSSVYRIFVGGQGALTGVYFIISSASIGLIYHYLYKCRKISIKFLNLYIFGVVIHVNMLLWILLLPWPIALEAYKVIAIPVLVLFPFATYLFARILFDQEASILAAIKIDELAKFPSENPNPVLRFSKDGKVLYTNEAGKLLLIKWKLGIGKTVSQEWRDLITQAFASEQVIEHEQESQGRVFSIIIAPVKEAGYVNLYAKDITERKQIQHELQESEEHFRLLAEFAPLGIYQGDANGDCVYMNKWWQEITGLSSEKVLGKGWVEAIHPDDRDSITEKWYRSVKTNSDYSAEYRFVTPEGKVTWISEKSIILRDDSGRVNGYLTAALDITELKLAEAKLRESEEKYKTIVQSSKDAIGILSHEQVIVDSNPASLELFGCKNVDDLISLTPADLAPEYQPDGSLSSVKSQQMTGIAMDKGSHFFEWKYKRMDGEEFFATVHLVKVVLSDQESLMVTMRDINDSKLAEAKLKESEDKYKTMFKSSKDAITIAEKGNVFIDANPAALEIFGYDDIDQFISLSPADVSPEYQPDGTLSSVKAQQMIDIAMDKGSHFFEWKLKRCSGEEIYSTVHLVKVIINDQELVMATIRDINKRKLAEQEREHLEVQLRQAQKLEAIGTLAGGIAHDFNNILTLIIGYTDLTIQQTKAESAERKNLEQVLIASDRAKSLINQILSFSRKMELKQVPTEIAPIVEEVLNMLRSSIPSNVVIKQKLEAKESVVKANSTQIHQVLVNLCTNAIHAIGEDEGVLDVSLSTLQLESPLVTKFGSLLPGSYAKLTILDNGGGIDPEVMNRIFEPFFTTKAVNKGTGMGLSVVHGIIENHKGLITVDSKKGFGTKFEVYLPRIKSKALGSDDVVDLIRGNGEKILLVDDQLLIVTVMKKTLERLNYQVVGYTDSQKALDDFRDDHEKFDLVITDYSMPDMTGMDLAKKLSAIRSDIPIILYTGYSGSIDPEKARQSGVTEIVSKPIDKKKISVIIHNILSKGE